MTFQPSLAILPPRRAAGSKARHFSSSRRALVGLLSLEGDLGQPEIGVGPRPADIQHINEMAFGLLQVAPLEGLAAFGQEIVGKFLDARPRFVGAGVSHGASRGQPQAGD